MTTITLQELAARFELTLVGEGTTPITGVCGLAPGKPGCISFLNSPKFRAQLGDTRAAAVIVSPRDAGGLRLPGLVAKDPYLAYARIARLFDPDRAFQPGIQGGAVVSDSARLGPGCFVGANAVIESGVVLGEGVYIGPGCVIGRDSRIGAGSRLVAQVTIGPRVLIGARLVAQPGAVIGSRGFGNARGPAGWEEVPQLGSVRIGDDVEIGANTCIDRGAIDDTVIENGVRLDNLIQVAHNVHIGMHTAIAACTGIAGSTRIGARCMIGGACGISGHLEIGDDVILLGRTMVTGHIPAKGVYGSGMPMMEARDWRRAIARIRRLGRYEDRIRALERHLDLAASEDKDDEQDHA